VSVSRPAPSLTASFRYLGAYSDEEDAARAADAACAERGLPRPNAAVLSGDMYRVTKAKSSVYWGVSWSKAASSWEARIIVEGRSIHCGLFANEMQAARTADAARIANGMTPRNEALLSGDSALSNGPRREGPASGNPSSSASAAAAAGSSAASSAAADRAGANAMMYLSSAAAESRSGGHDAAAR